MRFRATLLTALLLMSALPAGAGLGFYGWGPRLGVGDDPDQIIIGLHQDFGEFVERVRFQPNFELGLGDDHTIASITLPVHYRFAVEASVVPYVGGGLLVAYIDRDLPSGHKGKGGDDSGLDLAPVVVGGIEWRMGKSSDMLLELTVAGGDSHDAKILVGWIFRAR